MKILRLETYNLASLEGKNTIDFESGILGESNIFCIVGPTGSGKSTILDAICLPLYGRAPRYTPKGKRDRKIATFGAAVADVSNDLSPTDPRNILTRGQKQCYSKVTFQANDGKIYRAEWSDEFRRVRYAKEEKRLFLVTKDASGKKTEEERDWNSLERIIGLDYNQFLRTVLIAQGDFAEFLNSEDDARCDLLEKLVGNQNVYTSITDGIKNLSDKAKNELDLLKADNASKEKDLLPKEEYDNDKIKLKGLQDKESQRQQQLKETDKQLNWYAEQSQLLKTIQEKETQLTSAQIRREAIKDEEQLLSLHDNTQNAVAAYRQLTDSVKNESDLEKAKTLLDKEVETLQKSIAGQEEDHKKLTERAHQAAVTLETGKPKIDKAKAMVVQLESLTSDATDKQKRLTAALNSLHTAEKNVRDNTTSITKAQQKVTAQNDALAKLQKDLIDKQTELNKAATESANAFLTEKTKTDGLDAAILQKDKEEAVRKMTDMTTAKNTLTKITDLKGMIADAEGLRQQKHDRNEEIDMALSSLNTDDLEKEVETLTRSYTLMTSENWEHHRSMLHDGEPCPLCGATEHPYHDKANANAVISEHKALLDDKKKVLREKQEKARKLSVEKAGNEGQITQLNNSLNGYQRELATSEDNWKGLVESYPSLTEDVASLETMLQSTKDEAATADRKLKAYNELIKNIEKLRGNKEAAEKKANEFKDEASAKLEQQKTDLQKAKDSLNRLQAQTEGLLTQQQKSMEDHEAAQKDYDKAAADLKTEKDALRDLMQDKDPSTYEQQLNKKKSDAEDAVEKSKAEIDKKNNRLSKLKGQYEQLTGQIDNLQKTIASQRTTLTKEIESVNQNMVRTVTEEDIRTLAGSSTDWESMRKRHTDIKDACLKARTEYETAKGAVEKHAETKPEKSEEMLTAEKEALDKQNYTNDITELTFRLRRHDEAVKALGEQKEKLEKASKSYNDWHELLEAIGGSEGKTLRKVVQSYTLRFLVAHANAEIRRFYSRYELKQVENSLSLRVIDHDRGNDERDTTTLSGGETFIVSLGLALGLSSLSSRNISFGNLFIDEGFGTLDPDSLATVIDALSSLQTSQGKKVGVISHTDTMAERIPTQIRVIKEGNTGNSRIEIV
ncbi:MAG: AAA family ATPase [Prevotella sp.]